jgi:hypothetical protein
MKQIFLYSTIVNFVHVVLLWVLHDSQNKKNAIPPNHINLLVFVMETHHVVCKLIIVQINFRIQNLWVAFSTCFFSFTELVSTASNPTESVHIITTCVLRFFSPNVFRRDVYCTIDKQRSRWQFLPRNAQKHIYHWIQQWHNSKIAHFELIQRWNSKF